MSSIDASWRRALAPLLLWAADFFVGYTPLLIFRYAALGGLGLVTRKGKDRLTQAALLLAGAGIVYQSLVGLF